MAYLREVGQGLRRAGDFVVRHGANIGKGLLTAAAVGAAAYGAYANHSVPRQLGSDPDDPAHMVPGGVPVPPARWQATGHGRYERT